jgi:hypothetical protein
MNTNFEAEIENINSDHEIRKQQYLNEKINNNKIKNDQNSIKKDFENKLQIEKENIKNAYKKLLSEFENKELIKFKENSTEQEEYFNNLMKNTEDELK